MCTATRSRSEACLGVPPEAPTTGRPSRSPGLAALAAALLCCLTARPGGAEEAAPDSSGRPTPRGALIRSAVLPGWGQYRNDRPLKALSFAAAAAGFTALAVTESRGLARARTPSGHEERAARRNSAFLYVALTATFAALDAYVDAHLADFGESPTLGVGHDGDVPGLLLRVRFAWDPGGWWRLLAGASSGARSARFPRGASR